MVRTTVKSYRNQVMYSVFVRNYSEEGTFEALRRDLQRIKDLGTDIIWLMPIHPLGEKARKGSLGSPMPSGITGLSTRNMAAWRIFKIWLRTSTVMA